MKDLLLTLDIGTGSARARLVANTGKILGFAQLRVRTDHAAGRLV